MRASVDLPYITGALAGTGGVVRSAPEDFFVEERPLYEPSGEGEHLFLWVEKRGVTSFDVARRIANGLGRSPRSVGYAGLKDAKAVTRQRFSVSGVSEDDVRALESDKFTILDVKRHERKLRTGHLKGNYFRITIRGAGCDAVGRAKDIMAVLEKRGVPNLYGPQRFGVQARSVVVGRALLRRRYNRALQAFLAPCRSEEGSAVAKARKYAWEGDYNRALALFPRSFVPERNLSIAMRQAGLLPRGLDESKARLQRVLRAVPKRFLEFYVSALQAALFNEVMRRRFDSIDKVMDGDLAWIHSKGAVFKVEDAEAEGPRAERIEISPSGPIFGYKMPAASGLPGEMESEVLDRARLKLTDFRMRIGLKNKGVRRPLRVPLSETSVEPAEGGVTVGFFLPKGAYATIVLREIMKPEGWRGLV